MLLEISLHGKCDLKTQLFIVSLDIILQIMSSYMYGEASFLV